jgi:hypothetical protein
MVAAKLKLDATARFLVQDPSFYWDVVAGEY